MGTFEIPTITNETRIFPLLSFCPVQVSAKEELKNGREYDLAYGTIRETVSAVHDAETASKHLNPSSA